MQIRQMSQARGNEYKLVGTGVQAYSIPNVPRSFKLITITFLDFPTIDAQLQEVYTGSLISQIKPTPTAISTMDSASPINFQRLTVRSAQIMVYGEEEADYLQFPWPGTDTKVARKVSGWFPKRRRGSRWGNPI